MKTALISVSDKSGLVEFAKGLEKLGWQLVSTGGTFKTLSEAGIKARQVSDLTGFPEILDGRVKTLHPIIHAGILALRKNPEHVKKLEELKIQAIDLVVVNLYPFKETIARPGVKIEEAIENIDIGGPTMIRAAAKNFEGCSAIVDPKDYKKVLEELNAKNNELSEETRKLLCAKAFQHTASYDSLISNYLHERFNPSELFPQDFSVTFSKVQECRYGENPHQKGALYKEAFQSGNSLLNFAQLHGKELSFNNFYDLNSAWNLCKEFSQPCAVIVKHTNPCGCAIAESISEAFAKAYGTDPLSAFGSIIALNRQVDEKTAGQIGSFFNEAIIAPSYSEKALEILKGKKNLRLIELNESSKASPLREFDFKKVDSGLLVQEKDSLQVSEKDLKFVSERKPSENEIQDLLFGWKIVKHVKSNAIVVVKNGQLLGTGAGQMSRVDSVKIAIEKAGDKAKGGVLASDAFFPFRDSLDLAFKAGITALIETGGSVKDNEVIQAANELKQALVFTGARHFKH
ncbi:MAG: bifunctional phosphoribosylaminoimidazolecarboxamide formyltransferase/IMP cyclohydrolase [Candidatus Diapherotrites archaeon]|nr:bifunctional phosphoribosylaminoimidazolecarboxamide formyltransferase/IMP cyclohydrolase [Candidatus Diapherotrites archaeon]